MADSATPLPVRAAYRFKILWTELRYPERWAHVVDGELVFEPLPFWRRLFARKVRP